MIKYKYKYGLTCVGPTDHLSLASTTVGVEGSGTSVMDEGRDVCEGRDVLWCGDDDDDNGFDGWPSDDKGSRRLVEA